MRESRLAPPVDGSAAASDTAERPLDRLAADPRLSALRSSDDAGSGVDIRFRRLSRLAATLLEVPTAFVSLVDEHRRFFSGARGLTASMRQRRALPISETLCDHVARAGEVLAIADTRDHPVTLAHPGLASDRVTAYVGVPIRDGATGEVLGTLCAIDQRVREWTSAQISVLEEIAAAAASEIGVRAVASQLEELHREQRFLAEVGAAVASSLDLATLARTVIGLTVEHFADHAAITLSAGGVATTIARPEDHADPLLRFFAEATDRPLHGPASPLLAGGSAERIEAVESLRAVGAHTALAVPIGHGGRRGGTLMLVATDPGRAYSDVDVHLAEEVARIVGLAVENARLFSEARSAVQAREDMLSVVSHDLRNPLGVISMATQLLEDSADRLGVAESNRYLSMIRRAAESAVVLVSDLLEVARLEAGRYRPARRPLDARALIAEVRETQQPLADRAGVRLECSAPAAPRTLNADRERLLRVFANLVGNAFKFTPRGGSVRVGAESEAGGVRFYVADTGSGIADENLDRLFSRFWQAEESDERGAGLGLSIVKAIVEAHDGRVWAESRLGEGTTIHFWIPDDASARDAGR